MKKILFLILGLSFYVGSVFAAEKACNPTTEATVSVVKENTEDGRFIVAKVQHKGAPVKQVVVAFWTPRLFGDLIHGEVETDENGVATLPFPEGLPGDAKTGDFSVTAKIIKSNTFFGSATIKVDGGKTLKQVEDPFPREIWSPNTHWYLLLTIPILILSVWSVYIFSISQLVKLSKTK